MLLQPLAHSFKNVHLSDVHRTEIQKRRKIRLKH